MTLLRSGSASDLGLVRSSNQDLALEGTNLYVVADGMGGHAGGEVASRVAVDALEAAFARNPTGAGLSEAVSSANAVVWQHSHENPDLRGMGTTLTAVALVNEDGNDALALVNVGDSRAYQFRDGELTQITTDHSLAEEMVLNGELTPAEAAVHPHRHILTRALGVYPEVTVDLWWITPRRGDRFLLCSDGLTNEIGSNQIAEVLSTVTEPQEAADLLVRAACSHGGSDNITALVVDVVLGEEDGGSTPAAADVPMAAGTDLVDDIASRPAEVPEAEPPSRRERRRARRRDRKLRGRRLITFRTLLFVVLLAAIVAGAYGAVRWYNTNSYYVGLDGQQLVIYQGRIGGLLWYQPKAVVHTHKTTADVPATYLPALKAGVEESSLAGARTYVKNLVDAENSTHPPPTTTLPPTVTTVTGSTPTSAASPTVSTAKTAAT